MAQRSIKSFFQPLVSAKRSIETGGDAPNGIGKKLKENGDATNDSAMLKKISIQAKLTPALSDNIGVSWFNALESEFNKEYFRELSRFIESERKNGTVYPPQDQVFRWTQLADIKDVKVVLLGQDPYHGPNQAHGLAFSVRKGVAPPPSLRNMFKELKTDTANFVEPSHGDLTGWAKQGVLLLNACLTVRKQSANSHSQKGWENLTDAVIKWINKHSSNVVFLLWGAYAQKKGAFIDKKKHLVLQCPHPSPLSASRGFLGCKHFSKTNDYLKKCGKSPIDWSQLP